MDRASIPEKRFVEALKIKNEIVALLNKLDVIMRINVVSEIFKTQLCDEQITSKYAHLTFGLLTIENRFIAFPHPGDDSGHGGLVGMHYIFIKTKTSTTENSEFADLENNAVNLLNGAPSHFPDSMPVIRVA